MKRFDLGAVLTLACLMAALGIGACVDQPISDGAAPELDAGLWTQLEPTGDVPVGESLVEMVYDPDSQKLIACGLGPHILQVGTWMVDPATGLWTERDGYPDGPPGRDGHSLVYDLRSKEAILFGGQDTVKGGELNDTWAYNPAANVWTELEPDGDVPPARSESFMVYDARSGLVVLFGGWLTTDKGDDSLASGLAGDTWVFDPVANSWALRVPSGASPPPRCRHAMVYDEGSGRVIMFGGLASQGDVNDTWAYDPAANLWTKLDPVGDVPPARRGHRMVFDESSGKIVLFGGTVGYRDANDTWIYDPVAIEWSEATPQGELPPPRSDHAMVSDPTSGCVVIFGGWGGPTRFLFDMWAYHPGE